LEHDDQVGTTGRSSRANKVVGRFLRLVETQSLTPAVAADEQAPRIETNPQGWEASISVFWDQPPCEMPTISEGSR